MRRLSKVDWVIDRRQAMIVNQEMVLLNFRTKPDADLLTGVRTLAKQFIEILVTDIWLNLEEYFVDYQQPTPTELLLFEMEHGVEISFLWNAAKCPYDREVHGGSYNSLTWPLHSQEYDRRVNERRAS